MFTEKRQSHKVSGAEDEPWGRSLGSEMLVCFALSRTQGNSLPAAAPPGRSLAVCKIEYCPWVPDEMDTSDADFFTIKPAVKTKEGRVSISVSHGCFEAHSQPAESQANRGRA